jgi:glyoxylate/hydroxypyruvate reductase
MDELARKSDVAFVIAPGGSATKQMINKRFLTKMRSTSILVNSRGSVVDEMH